MRMMEGETENTDFDIPLLASINVSLSMQTMFRGSKFDSQILGHRPRFGKQT
jgi:hypothetical protein